MPGRVVGLAASVLTALLVFVRCMPSPAGFFGDSPDGSWAWGIDFAAAHGYVFGRDIVFNYGPYGPVATRIFDPALRAMFVVGGSILALAMAAGLLAMRRPVAMLMVALLLPLIWANDALAFAMCVPAILLSADAARAAVTRRARLAVLALVPALALLPFMKGIFIGTSVLAAGTIAVLLCMARQFGLAAAAVALGLVCFVGLWAAAGQPIAALPDYFAGSLRIIEGHNEAMAWPGPVSHVALAAAAALVFLALFAWSTRRMPPLPRLVAAGSCGGIMFIAFKAGFVREDGHEAITYATFGLMFAVLGAWLARAPAAIAGVIAGLLLIVPAAETLSLGGVPFAALAGARDSIVLTYRLFTDAGGMHRDYDSNNAWLPRLPWHPAGTADIYSSDQARLLASGLPWAPRPDFQSYNVSSPALAAANAQHLLGRFAPDNVFFRIEPIDLRLPALEDGLSWPLLLSLYEPAGYDPVSRLAWLRRGAPPAVASVAGADMLDATEQVGATVPLPPGPQALWARIDLRRSRAGELSAALWQAPSMWIRLSFADGSQRSFRFIPGMARSGFLLSPFVSDTRGFLRLRADAQEMAPPLPRPVAMMLTPDGGMAWAWRRKYRLRLAPIAFPALRGRYTILGVMRPAAAASPLPLPAATCSLDTIDGEPVPGAPVAAGSPLTLNGWAMFDLAQHQLGDHTEIGFLAADGRWFAVPAPPVARDLSGALHIAAIARPAFDVTPDLSDLPAGVYAVYIVVHRGGDSRICGTALRLAVPAKAGPN